jgi:hypothetical protein
MPRLLNCGTCVSFAKRMLRFLSGAESLPVFLVQHGIANLFMLLNIGNFSLDFTDQLKQRPSLLATGGMRLMKFRKKPFLMHLRVLLDVPRGPFLSPEFELIAFKGFIYFLADAQPRGGRIR